MATDVRMLLGRRNFYRRKINAINLDKSSVQDMSDIELDVLIKNVIDIRNKINILNEQIIELECNENNSENYSFDKKILLFLKYLDYIAKRSQTSAFYCQSTNEESNIKSELKVIQSSPKKLNFEDKNNNVSTNEMSNDVMVIDKFQIINNVESILPTNLENAQKSKVRDSECQTNFIIGNIGNNLNLPIIKDNLEIKVNNVDEISNSEFIFDSNSLNCLQESHIKIGTKTVNAEKFPFTCSKINAENMLLGDAEQSLQNLKCLSYSNQFSNAQSSNTDKSIKITPCVASDAQHHICNEFLINHALNSEPEITELKISILNEDRNINNIELEEDINIMGLKKLESKIWKTQCQILNFEKYPTLIKISELKLFFENMISFHSYEYTFDKISKSNVFILTKGEIICNPCKPFHIIVIEFVNPAGKAIQLFLYELLMKSNYFSALKFLQKNSENELDKILDMVNPNVSEKINDIIAKEVALKCKATFVTENAYLASLDTVSSFYKLVKVYIEVFKFVNNLKNEIKLKHLEKYAHVKGSDHNFYIKVTKYVIRIDQKIDSNEILKYFEIKLKYIKEILNLFNQLNVYMDKNDILKVKNDFSLWKNYFLYYFSALLPNVKSNVINTCDSKSLGTLIKEAVNNKNGCRYVPYKQLQEFSLINEKIDYPTPLVNIDSTKGKVKIKKMTSLNKKLNRCRIIIMFISHEFCDGYNLIL